MELSSGAAIAFWIAVALIVIASKVHNYLRHRETQRTLRVAIEKGDEPTIARLSQTAGRSSIRAEDLMLGGVIHLASGVGLFIFGLVANLNDDKIIYPMVAIGVLVFLVGVGLLVFGGWLRKQGSRTPNG